MSAMAVAAVDAHEVARRIMERPSRVIQLVRMMAVAMSVGARMETDEEISFWMQRALEEWNSAWAKVVARGAEVSEDEFAGQYIDYVRRTNYCGWGDILRKGTQ